MTVRRTQKGGSFLSFGGRKAHRPRNEIWSEKLI